MDSLMEWGLQVIAWFQQFSPALDRPFQVFTLLGGEEFFLLLLPLVYWCLDRRIGSRLIIAFLLGVYVNAVAKTLAAQPRPAEYAPGRVKVLWEASGYGFPSGHAQHAVVVWGYLATQARRRWVWALTAVMTVFIPLSRIYLGVHFPHDILGGYAVGLVLLFLYLRLEPGIGRWLGEKGLAWQLGVALAAPLLLILLFTTDDSVTAGATLMGMSVGFALERRWIRFDSAGPPWKRVARYLLGIAVMMTLWLGLRIVFTGLEPATLFRFVRYGLVGVWGALGAPWAFRHLRLA